MNRRFAAALVLVATAAIACAEAPAPVPSSAPPPSMTPPVAVAAVVVASAAAPPVAQAAPSAAQPGTLLTPAIRDALPPDVKQRLSMLGALCPSALKHLENGQIAIGCTTCAPFDPATMPKPMAAPVVDPSDFFPLEAAIEGSFSAPGKKEAALVFTGCEPHAANYGGTELVDISQGGYRHIAYASAVHPYAVKTIRRKDGRDLLLGAYADGHQGYNVDYLFSFDFTKSFEDGYTLIYGVADNTGASCFAGVLPGTTRAVGDALDGFDVLDGPPRVVARAIEHHGSIVSAAFKKACAAATAESEKENGKPVDLRESLGAAKHVTKTIPFNGTAFKKAPFPG